MTSHYIAFSQSLQSILLCCVLCWSCDRAALGSACGLRRPSRKSAVKDRNPSDTLLRCAQLSCRSADAEYAWKKMDGLSVDGRRIKIDYATKVCLTQICPVVLLLQRAFLLACCVLQADQFSDGQCCSAAARGRSAGSASACCMQTIRSSVSA